MQRFLLAFFLLGLVIAEDQLQVASIADADVKAGVYRKLSAYASPSWANANSVGVKGGKLDIDADDKNAVLDVAGFTFRNPAAGGDVNFYFAYFTGDASWTSTTVQAAASLSEFSSGFSHIFSYEDHDGKPGFQTQLGNDFWDCNAAATGKFDCIPHSYVLSALSWTSLALTNQSCPAGGSYHPDCRVFSLTTVGSQAGTEVVRFTLKVSSQPVLVDNYQLTPDFGKIDISINFPWTDEKPTARVGILGYAGGKSTGGSFSASSVVDDKASFTWGSNGKQAYYSWDGTALLNGNTEEPVYVQTISGTSIANYACTGCGLLEAAFYAGQKLVVGAWKGLGWEGSYVFFSWAADKPSSVYWDPQIGVNENNSALHLVPFFPVLMAIFYALFH